MGHSRSRQGLHSTCSRTMRAQAPVGPVVVSSVAPNTVTVGTPSADAMCMAPESLVRNKPARSGQIDELAQRGFAGEVADRPRRGADRAGNRFAQRAFRRRAEQRHRSAVRARHRAAASAKRSGKPALGIAIGGAGADSDHRRRHASAEQRRRGPAARAASRPSSRMSALGGYSWMIPGAAQQFQIIEALMPRDLAGLGRRNGLGQQPAAPIAPVADAARNARHPRQQRGVEGIGQQDARNRSSRGAARRRPGAGRPRTASRRRWRFRARRDRPPTAAPAPSNAPPGNASRTARMAGSDITASPTQLVARIRIFV